MEWTALADENDYRCLSIEAPWEEITADYNDLVTRYAATVRLPGFRPGKAPRVTIEQRFHKEIMADLSVRTIQRLGREAVRETGVEALGPLEASEIACDKGKPFRARVRYIPMPEILLPELTGLLAAEDGADPRDLISLRLLALVPFAVPDELVNQELALDGLGESKPGSDVWKAATERIRLMVILRRIARQEGIEVDEADVNRRIAEKAQEFGTTIKKLQTELEEGGGMVRLRDMLLAESTLEYLLEINKQEKDN
jgi:FKBP-type peptidyl-prolyl cis-trans isomerase (trigger factor)